MSEASMVEMMQEALATRGIHEELVAVGQFNPRGHVGSLFAGGMVGSEAGGLLGGVAEGVGLAFEMSGGPARRRREFELPGNMLVGVSAATVFGFAARTRSKPPTDLVFKVLRAGLTVKVHQRVNVRVLETEDADGSSMEFEGNRVPLTHSKDVIDELRS